MDATVYFVRPHQFLPKGVLTEDVGARWLHERRNEGQPLILVATHRNASNNVVIARLVSDGVRYVIPRQFPPAGWYGGPVLAPWPDSKTIKQVEQSPDQITSLCVLQWIEGENQEWLAEHNALEVSVRASLR